MHILWQYVSDRVLEISTLSSLDFVLITGHYNLIVNGDNRHTDGDFAKRGYTEAQIKIMRKQESVAPLESQNIRFLEPLNNFKFSLMPYLLTLFENYERGTLPFQGCTSEQPAQVMEMFSLLQSLRHELTPKPKKQVKQDVGLNKGKHRSRQGSG